jgi:protein SCO1/2
MSRLLLRGALLLALCAPLGALAVNLYRPDIRLTDERGAAVTLSAWRGRPAIFTMEYSECRFTCSVVLSKLKALQAAADARGKAIDIIVVSIDPDHDTPEAWARYRKTRSLDRPNWHFLTASARDTPTLARLMGIAYWREDEHIMHDFKLLRVAADGEVLRVLDNFGDDVGRLLE